jgi:uncharacterized protein involved in cysteine biosynthesis
MLTACARAIDQLGDPAIRRVLIFSILGGIAGFVLLVAAAGWLLAETHLFAWSWLEWTIDVLGGVTAVVLAYLMFPGLVGATAGLLLDDVAAAVERRHYPHLPPGREPPLIDSIVAATALFFLAAGLNILLLPLYLVPLLGQAAFVTLNGYLLSREYFELAAMRRMDRKAASRFRRKNRVRVFAAGLGIGVLLLIPFANLLAPVLGTALMVHIFHAIGSDSSEGA